jgi:uncharacterized RDD family membrane protein YckC
VQRAGHRHLRGEFSKGPDMSDTSPRPSPADAAWRGGFEAAYDPQIRPELFRGVLTRRVVAFLIDLVILAIPLILAVIFIAVFGLVTFGLGWVLFWLISPASVIWALAYYGFTLGGPHSATIGMRTVGLQMRTWFGEPAYFLLGATHAVVFWVSVSILTPLVLLVGLFNSRRRLLHDFVLGTVIINTPDRP